MKLDKASYDELAATLSSSFGVPKNWISDVASYNLEELAGASFGVIGLALNWNRADQRRFADYAASLGIAALFSANPILGIVGLVSLARAFQTQNGGVKYTELLKGVSQGGLGTGILLISSSAIGGPAWIGLIVGLTLSVYARKQMGDADAARLADWMIKFIRKSMRTVSGAGSSLAGVLNELPLFHTKPQET